MKTALDVLKTGGVVILPTDTVYGIACDSQNASALTRIFEIKKRAPDKRIAWLVADVGMADSYVDISPALKDKLKNVWPGAFTGIFSRKDGSGTEGIRMPDYRFVQDLARALGRPIAATSANISGEEPITKIADILRIFGSDSRIELIVDAGDLPASMASTVVDFTKSPPEVLRRGAVDSDQFIHG